MNENLQKLSKSIRDCISPLVAIQKNAELDDKQAIAQVLDKLIEAQAAVAFLQGQYSELEETLSTLQRWQVDETLYQPFRMFSGVTVVVLKDPPGSSYQKDWYCKHCFDNKKRSMLQPEPRKSWLFTCPECRTGYQLNPRDQEAYNEARSHPNPSASEGVHIEPGETQKITKGY